jgi:excisionase family DNA binding protein
MKEYEHDRAHDETAVNEREDSIGCFTTESLAERLNVSRKFIVTHRQHIAGAIKVGRIWRFDKAAVEKRLLSGSLF